MSTDHPKQIVTSGYDRCAGAYMTARARDPGAEIELLANKLSVPARILDVGCGAGLPVTEALARLGTVVGVDISATQIELARTNVPSAQLIGGDIMAQEFAAASFDAVVAYYVLSHLPRQEQPTLLTKLSGWLRPGGYLLATLPRTDDPGYTESDFFGVTMYWSQYETAWYVEFLAQAGFEIEHLGGVGHGYTDAATIPAERHALVLGRLRRSSAGIANS